MPSALPLPSASLLLTSAFSTLALALAAAFVTALYVSYRRAGGPVSHALGRTAIAAVAAALWLAFTGTAAALGFLGFSAPPTMLVLLGATLALALVLGLSPVGRRLATGVPLAWLVGFQGFRVLVELLLHRAYVEGLMPVQMSYAGRNFDIVSGITALGLAAVLATGRRPLALVAIWNALGLGLLANILVIALLSTPTPIRVFMNEPANVWITATPWVWLPTVMVLAAIVGHIVLWRHLILSRRGAAAQESAAPHGSVPLKWIM
jgi:hypothetical protein